MVGIFFFFWRLSKVSCLLILCDIQSSSTHALFTPCIIYLIHTGLHTILSVTKNKLSWLRFNKWHVLPRRILLESFCQMWPVHTVIWKTIAFSRKTAAFNVIKISFQVQVQVHALTMWCWASIPMLTTDSSFNVPLWASMFSVYLILCFFPMLYFCFSVVGSNFLPSSMLLLKLI